MIFSGTLDKSPPIRANYFLCELSNLHKTIIAAAAAGTSKNSEHMIVYFHLFDKSFLSFSAYNLLHKQKRHWLFRRQFVQITGN